MRAPRIGEILGRPVRRVHIVTDARKPLSQDIAIRQRRYLVSMGIRTVCLILAITIPMPLPLRIAALIAAIGVPWIAVVFANSGRHPEEKAQFESGNPVQRDAIEGRREIDSGQTLDGTSPHGV